jgi:hypothetical protein
MIVNRASLLGIAAAAVAAAVLVWACSNNSRDDEVPELPSVTATSSGGSPTPNGGPAASPTPLPSPTPDPEAEREDVIEAATSAIDGARHVSPLTLDACLEDNPDRNPCIELKSAPEELVHGLARFTLGDPDGGATTFLMGRMASGEWGYWRGSQQQSYLLDALPGQVLACNTDSEPTVRTEPRSDARPVATLEDLAELMADEFVLVTPGQYAVQGERGEGWYHVTEPAGWIDATQTTDAHLGDCLLHDAVEQVDHG